MNNQEFYEAVENLGIVLTDIQKNQLDLYCSELLKYNEHTNLTALKSDSDVYLKHFYDSLTLISIVDMNAVKSLIDIGSGAGFPGLVIKIFYPNISITLLDSNHKKTDFLAYMCSILNFNDVNIVNQRVEDFYHTTNKQYDLVVARAVASLDILVELCLPLVKIDGYFLAMKGEVKEELEKYNPVIMTIGGKIEKIKKFNLPKENSQRTLILIKKFKQTPKEYPRPYNKIIKKPLKIIEK